MNVLVTGATGYVGGRLVPRLLERGHAVRVLVRDPARIAGRRWADQVEVVKGDLVTGEGVAEACAGMDVVYYLVHSMGGGKGFADRDRQAAQHVVDACGDVGHVIYLGGLMPGGGTEHAKEISQHLTSRAEVGEVLRAGLPGRVTEFRAGPVIGSGSASFEMVRYLTERLPIMVAPRWVNNVVQPISIRDVMSYLLAAVEHGPADSAADDPHGAPADNSGGGGVVPIGADRLTFKQMMLVYAELRGLWRVVIPVPVLAPALAARWVGLVTPISNRLAVPLVEGVIEDLVGDTAKAQRLYPQVEPLDYRAAVKRALERVQAGAVETRWTGALGTSSRRRQEAEPGDVALGDWEGMIREVRQLEVDAPPQRVFEAFSSLGGETGWLVWGWAWALRGVLDKLVGGPGLRRGRRHPTELLAGEALDWWRVEAVEPGQSVLLRAEMKVPGRAWLRYKVEPDDAGHTRLEQTALFEPRGLPGVLYWWGLYPLHRLIFTDMAKAIARRAERMHNPPA